MKWITDRDPKSPGMYAVDRGYMFLYFDGKGWHHPLYDTQEPDYLSRPNWSPIFWGRD